MKTPQHRHSQFIEISLLKATCYSFGDFQNVKSPGKKNSHNKFSLDLRNDLSCPGGFRAAHQEAKPSQLSSPRSPLTPRAALQALSIPGNLFRQSQGKVLAKHQWPFLGDLYSLVVQSQKSSPERFLGAAEEFPEPCWNIWLSNHSCRWCPLSLGHLWAFCVLMGTSGLCAHPTGVRDQAGNPVRMTG